VLGPEHKKKKFTRSGDTFDNGDGSYKVTYLAAHKGYYAITIMANGVHIKGSPFRVWVSAATPTTADTAAPVVTNLVRDANAPQPGVNLLGASQALMPQEFIPWTAYSPCPNDCMGRGSCVRGVCMCYTGFQGEDCSYSPHQCPLACSGNGRCDNGVCQCFYDWTGEACNIKSACPFNCSSHGKCLQGTCICDKGYTGSDCSNSQYLCPSGCSGNGECINAQCECYPGFEGEDCATDTSVQKYCPKLCSGHGSCAQSGICNCDIGFSGASCSTKASTLLRKTSSTNLNLVQAATAPRATSGCSSAVGCNDNGECIDGKCACYPGFSGHKCEIG